MAREFYKAAWRRGLDIKFGLAAFIMHAFCMAPVSALGVVVMYFLLRQILRSDRQALWLSLLYAFGTPVFFRTGYLNQNLMLGHFTLMGFLAMWNPSRSVRWTVATRFLLGGLAGGTALLFDYSGMVLLLGLFIYGLVNRLRVSTAVDAFRHGCCYVFGTLAPVCLLWWYQWKSFGHPFYPGQHWMPPVEWIELGYQGYGWPQLELFLALAVDYRFGLFVNSPLMLLAVLYPLVSRKDTQLLPNQELVFVLSVFLAFWLFFSGSNYTRLQFNTGIRYMTPILPFLFLPAALMLLRMPRPIIYFVAVVSVTESWCLAMVRDVERGFGVLDPMLRVFIGGFQLPVLNTISRLSGEFGELVEHGVSPLPLFVLAGVILYGVWSPRLAALRSLCVSPIPNAEK